MNINEQYQAWLSCPAMTEELLSHLRSMDSNEKNDCFFRSLAFGTGGLRGMLGAGTNRMNLFTVAKATKGLGKYLLEHFTKPSCAISFDSRIHSRDFAETASAVLADMGIHVWLYPSLEPTPMLSFAVRHLNTSAGIMITASHNPAKYNGYKVYGADGCQITLNAANEIQKHINLQPDLCDSLPSFNPLLAAGAVRFIDQETIESYYKSILKLSSCAVSCPLYVVYSPLNGTGNIPVREIMKRMGNIHVTVVPEQELPDGNFPTCPYPNPEIREAMSLAIQKTLETKADFCFATDPDCDRMGAGVRCGNEVRLITGNEMGILMLDYLCRVRPVNSVIPPVVVKTIVTTEMASAVCQKYHLELRNVLTGFKYIGEQIGLLEKLGEKNRFLFGFEESYGYLSGTEVRDKDAVNAALLLCEMASVLKAEGKTMVDRLKELQHEFGFYMQRLLTFEYEGENGARHMDAIMRDLRQPAERFSEPVLRISEKTDYLSDETGLPRSDVVEWRLSDGSKIIIRPSGTEPKIKAYLFAQGSSEQDGESKLDELESIVSRLCG